MAVNSVMLGFLCNNKVINKCRKCLKTFTFPCVQNGVDARVTRRRSDNAAFGTYTNVTVTSQNNICSSARLCDEVKCCDGPGILHAKSRVHVLTPRELPC